MSSITFRDATSADYDDVMNISDVLFDGMDYLPTRYHDYCKDPQRHLFVAEDDGKVVAFAMRLVTDGRCQNVSQAHRVRKEYRGRGLMTSFGKHVHREIVKRHPNMERTVYIAVDRAAVDSTIIKLPYQKLLAIRPRFSCAIMLSNLLDILKSSEFQSLTRGETYQICRRQSEDEALALLLKEIPFTQFVHEGMWDIDWEPMGHHADNFQMVLKNSSFYVSRLPDNGAIQAISFFTMVRVAAGWRCQSDFYCPSTVQNPEVLVAHVLKHLEEISSLKDDDDVYIFLPTSHHESYPGEASKQLLFEHLKGLEPRGGSYHDELSDLLVTMDIADIESYRKAHP